MLSWVPGLGAPVRVILLDRQIQHLEDRGELDQARAVRSSALKEVPAKLTGPLWRSEGFDRLERRYDYPEALKAFTKAMDVLDQSSFLLGITGPERVWYGAAVSALKTGDLPRARELYTKLRDSLNAMPWWVKGGEGWRRYLDSADWLERNIPKEPGRASEPR